MRQLWKSSNEAELAFAEAAERLGYRVHRNGWPDFLISRGYDDNDMIAVEVKRAATYQPETGRARVSQSAKPTREQRRIHRLLRKLGLTVVVVRVNANGHPVKWNLKTRTWDEIPWHQALLS